MTAVKTRVFIRFGNGPLDGFTHSWITDVAPVKRIVTEWGTYQRSVNRDPKGWYVYRWRPVR